MATTNVKKLSRVSRLVRYWIIQMTTRAQSGHLTSSLSAVELMVGLLFGGTFRYDIRRPRNPSNDRLIFSKGHASPLYYALWAAAGAVSERSLRSFRQLGSPLEGHPSIRFRYTDAPTGSLGQGLSIGLGMALHARYYAEMPYRTYVLLGDSEMAEGSVWEAMQVAAHYKLANLIAIVDVNRLGQRGPTMLGYDITAYRQRAHSFGWRVITINGHSLPQILQAYQRAMTASLKPTIIFAKTVKGKGIPFLENKNGWHGKALYPEQIDRYAPEWKQRPTASKVAIRRPLSPAPHLPRPPKPYHFLPDKKLMSVREAAGHAITELGSRNRNIVVLDAEVSNSTKMQIFEEHIPERFFEMYIAEQNMVAVAVGLARRGLHPVVSSFAAFLLRAADQIRMAQYAGVPLMLIGSHAGVSIGKDGSSQMALEDMAFFRGLRNSIVLYPSDAVSTVGVVRIAAQQKGITYVRGTRSETATIHQPKTKFRIGGSVVLKRSSRDAVTIVAAGITVHAALAAAEELAQRHINVRVIDCYSIKPIDARTLLRAARETGVLVTVEDHYPNGGLGEAVTSAIYGITTPIHRMAVTEMPQSGERNAVLHFEGIDKRAIIQTVTRLVT